MKNLILLFCLLFQKATAQFKPVKIESEDIYVNFYYKLKQTKYIKNDTTYYLCKTINPTTFFLEKYINKIKVGKNKYEAIIAHDSLNVSEFRREDNGDSKIYKLKEPYYIGLKLKYHSSSPAIRNF